MSDSTMKRSWLIQRLEKPRGWGQFPNNPFSFGGGMKNGGLSDDAMSLIRGIFSFDYMGAAEYEFGAVPKALDRLAKVHKKLVAQAVDVDLATVQADFRQRDTDRPAGTSPVYVIAHKDEAAEVADRIRSFAAKEGDTRDRVCLARTLWPATEYDGDAVGWLELDNGFMFFTDREMWEQTCSLFGVKAPAVTA